MGFKYKSALKNEWNRESEKFIKQIGERSQGYVWMCDRDATYYGRWSNFFTFMAGILALGGGTAQFLYTSSLGDSSGEEQTYVQIILGVISYVVGGLVGIIKLNNFDKKVETLKKSSGKFLDISSDVQQQLNMQRIDRVPAVEYIGMVSKRYNKIVSKSSFGIRRRTIKNFQKQFSGRNITFPEVAGDITEIIIAEPRGVEISMSDSDVSSDGYVHSYSDYSDEDAGAHAHSEGDYSDDEHADAHARVARDVENPGSGHPLRSKRTRGRHKRNYSDSGAGGNNSGTTSEENKSPEKPVVRFEKTSADSDPKSKESESEAKSKVSPALSDEAEKEKKPRRKKTMRKKTRKSLGASSLTTYHLSHQPNINSINYQLSRLNS